MGRKLTFEWDAENLHHIGRHDVSQVEFEDTFRQPMIEAIVRVKDEDRVTALGKTSTGRYLSLVYTMRQGQVRAVTAYTMPRKLRKVYEEKIERHH